MDDQAISAVVGRLSRRHPSGGEVIERAAILAEGVDSGAILEWITAHGGQPESPAPASAATRGLHGGRLNGSRLPASAPRRYVLPPGVGT